MICSIFCTVLIMCSAVLAFSIDDAMLFLFIINDKIRISSVNFLKIDERKGSFIVLVP